MSETPAPPEGWLNAILDAHDRGGVLLQMDPNPMGAGARAELAALRSELEAVKGERDVATETMQECYADLLMKGWWYRNAFNGEKGQGEALPSAKEWAALRARLAAAERMAEAVEVQAKEHDDQEDCWRNDAGEPEHADYHAKMAANLRAALLAFSSTAR